MTAPGRNELNLYINQAILGKGYYINMSSTNS